MGQKVNPTGFRLGVIFGWKSRWFADRANYSKQVLEDYTLRKYLNKKLASAGLVQIDIERSITAMQVTLNVARPGVVIGKGGSNLEIIKKDIERVISEFRKDGKSNLKLDLRVEEFNKPDLSAKLVAERIIGQLEKRFPHRRAVSQAIEKVMQAGAKGVKIQLSGRIGGAEIGRREKYSEKSVPTQTLRANIDYFEMPASTRSGFVGLKVWIYKGDIL
jgi:small subunit ribosomal protein S3